MKTLPCIKVATKPAVAITFASPMLAQTKPQKIGSQPLTSQKPH